MTDKERIQAAQRHAAEAVNELLCIGAPENGRLLVLLNIARGQLQAAVEHLAEAIEEPEFKP